MTEKQIFSFKVVVVCVLLMALLVGVVIIKDAIASATKSNYDKARERISEIKADAGDDCIAFNLFDFNVGKINSGDLRASTSNLADEYQKKNNFQHFYNPIELYMEYQGHDWNGITDDMHSLVFSDGSSIVASVVNDTLHLEYCSGWTKRSDGELDCGTIKDLWIASNGSKSY